MNATARVIKGCPALLINKSTNPVSISIEAIDLGIKITGLNTKVYLSGNRVNLPKLKIGQRFNCHRGDPTKFITIEITDF